MTTLRTPRFWLMTTAAFMFSVGAQSAYAQAGYQAGAPTMVAAAPSFPTISADQIARDVTQSYNPRTGQTELVAGSFDAFEDDPSLAGAVSLRSADGAVAIDGQPLRNGALLEVDFYYSSPSDDPYGGRGYGYAGFVNGEAAPVVLRDSRILECSTRVENVVYDHANYYNVGLISGLYRPNRHYVGHSSFGFGFGRNYYGPGYGYVAYNNNRRVGRGYTRRSSSSHGVISSRVLNALGVNDSQDGRSDSETRSDRDRGGRNGRGATPRNTDRSLSERETERRLSRVESYGGTRPTGTSTRRNAQSATGRTSTSTRRLRGVNAESRIERAPATSESRVVVQSPKNSQPKKTKTNRTQSTKTKVQARKETRSTSKTVTSKKKTQKRTTRNVSKKSSTAKQKSRRLFNFFPGDAYGSRQVVTSSSVDCAREDKLRVFIPSERLDAARFDGLTVIAFDSQGGETPIYLPPNYIEGYRLAASGQIRPQAYAPVSGQTQPVPQYNQQPRPVIESAACPAGTTIQADGTCLQASSMYPTR